MHRLEDLSESKQREFASTGAAMGLSLTQIVILLAIVLPSRTVPSRARVERWVRQSEAQATKKFMRRYQAIYTLSLAARVMGLLARAVRLKRLQ